MKVIALCFLALTITASAAPTAGAPELEKLRTSYKAAVAKGTKTTLQAHIAVLERLRDIYTRGSNLPGAAKVQSDIDRVNMAMASGEFMPPAADAKNVSAPELDKLRAGNDADIERALKPIRETYVRELDKLRDACTRAANLSAAMAVQEEINLVKSGGKPGQVPKSEWHIGKTWTDGGTLWTFAKGGGGEVVHNTGKKTKLEWERMPSGAIQVKHEMTTKPEIGTAYISFTSPEGGMYGRSEDKLTRPIYLKQ